VISTRLVIFAPLVGRTGLSPPTNAGQESCQPTEFSDVLRNQALDVMAAVRERQAGKFRAARVGHPVANCSLYGIPRDVEAGRGTKKLHAP
jgi:hypothetical protein